MLAAALGYTLLDVEMPNNYPSLMASYSLVEAPPPPPPPPPPPAAAKSVAQTQVPVNTPSDMAPTVIPDTIPEFVEAPSEGVTEGITAGVVSGVVGGDPNGVAGGVVGGTVGGVIGGIIDDNNAPVDTVVIPRDEALPLASLSQTYPIYPEEARTKGWEDSMVVRYTIGKNGRVRLVEVLSKPQRPSFEKATVNAIRHWRFKPMLVNGVAKEVVHELTVNFELEWKQRLREAGKLPPRQ